MLTTLLAYGRTVGVDLPEELTAAVLRRLPPTYAAGDHQPERTWRVIARGAFWTGVVDGAPLASGVDPVHVAELLLSDLELWVAEHARDRVFIHAGCVVVDGRAIVVPGRTMSGKSSLTAAFVRAGATYFSDEYAVLDSAGRVHPYARPLSVRPYDGSQVRRVDVAELGGVAGEGAAEVGLIAHLRYDPGDPVWKRVSAGESVLHLVDNCVPVQSRPAEALDAMTAAAEGAMCLSGARGDADEAATRVLKLLAGG